MEPKRKNSDSKLNKMPSPTIDKPFEHLLPKFLLSDLNDKEDTRYVTESTRDENLESNFSNIDIYDSLEENSPILEDFKLKEVK